MLIAIEKAKELGIPADVYMKYNWYRFNITEQTLKNAFNFGTFTILITILALVILRKTKVEEKYAKRLFVGYCTGLIIMVACYALGVLGILFGGSAEVYKIFYWQWFPLFVVLKTGLVHYMVAQR
jgi:hypothetical protein